MKQAPKCKNFNGYKPCYPDHNCWDDGCKDPEPIGKKIVIINLDAMGDVLMTTAQLATLKEEFPESTFYWVTLSIAAPLLENNPYLDKVYVFNFESILILEAMTFDLVLNVDKSQRSCALLNKLNAKEKRGFGLNEDGKIIPVNEGALYNYRLGMDNELKFNQNTQFGQQYLAETFEIPYLRNEYVLHLTEEEKRFTKEYKKNAGIGQDDFVVGFNTGCSLLFPNKKMTVGQHITLIERLLAKERYKILLAGGPEDTGRNEEIASHFNGKIINTPTRDGLRKGICYENAADIIITGDSFGMHLAIALRKWVIAWFGLSCQQEIDLYDRGVKLWPEDLFCAPCWKKECPYNLECIDMIDLDRIIEEVDNYYLQWKEKHIDKAK